METLSLSDRQSNELIENVGRLLATELDRSEVRNRVDRTVRDYLKSKKLDIDSSEITGKLDWSVNVRLKK